MDGSSRSSTRTTASPRGASRAATGTPPSCSSARGRPSRSEGRSPAPASTSSGARPSGSWFAAPRRSAPLSTAVRYLWRGARSSSRTAPRTSSSAWSSERPRGRRPGGAGALVRRTGRSEAPRREATLLTGRLLRRRVSALLEEPPQARGMDPVVLAAVVADDLDGRAVVDHGFDLGAIQSREGRDEARLAAPTLEAHRGLVQVREGHAVEQLVAQAHGG